MRAVKNGLQQSRYLSTYYDSQSGLHIPMHNEMQISIFLNKSTEETSPSSFIPAQLYKEDVSSDMPDKLKALAKQGIHGVLLPPAQFPRDLRNIQTLSDIAPSPTFKYFVSSASPLPKTLPNVNLVLDFIKDDDTLTETLAPLVQAGMSTTLRLGDDICVDPEPLSVASQVAALIDGTGGGNLLWLVPPLSGADAYDVVQVCEELMYLDVAGPTIKSRIIMDTLNEEMLEETMMLGINKFVVKEESEIDVIADMAKWQGKELVLL